MNRPELFLWWEGRDPSRAQDAVRLARFVSGLPAYDPIYQSWLRSPKTGKQVLPVPLTDAQAGKILREKISKYDVGGIWPEMGSYVGAGHAGPPPYDFRESSYADTMGHIGAYGATKPLLQNNIEMRLSNLRPSTGRAWRASELRPLMKFALATWNPTEMVALFPFGLKLAPRVPDPTWASGVRILTPWIGWITYLPPDLAARAKYPSDVEVETLNDGASLVTLCEEPFDKTDVEGLARLRALEAALRPIQS